MAWQDGRAARAWLRAVAARVTPTRAVGERHWCCGVGLTAAGLVELRPEVEPDLERHTAFREGAAARAGRLRDDPTGWVVGAGEAHALVLVAACSSSGLAEGVGSHRELAARAGVAIVWEESGRELPGGREHFGFRDGVSQPVVRGFDVPEDAPLPGPPGNPPLPAGEFILGRPRFSGRQGDWPGTDCPAWMREGSFQVFRRLVQDVPGWWAQAEGLRGRLSGNGSGSLDRDAVAARLVGRWPSGAPLALASRADPGGDSPSNTFDFDDDPHGFTTPRFAHIRKMYPRTTSFLERDWHRIIRRGVPFGPPYEPGAADAGAERGLLFNAYMGSIEHQFEFLQHAWANGPDFFEPSDGPDPMIGTDLGGVTLRRRGAAERRLALERFVRTTGALYAFVPSLSALRYLAGELEAVA